MNDTLLIASVYVQKNYSIVITTLQGGCRSQDYKWTKNFPIIHVMYGGCILNSTKNEFMIPPWF